MKKLVAQSLNRSQWSITHSGLFVFPQFVAETDLSLAKGAVKLSQELCRKGGSLVGRALNCPGANARPWFTYSHP